MLILTQNLKNYTKNASIENLNSINRFYCQWSNAFQDQKVIQNQDPFYNKKGELIGYLPSFVGKDNTIDIALNKAEGHAKVFTALDTGWRVKYKSKKEFYKRNYKGHLKGDPKEKTYIVYNSIFRHVKDTWEFIGSQPETWEYIQTSTSRSHNERETVVIDFDANKFGPGYKSIDDAELDVMAFVAKYDLPDPSYLLLNKTSGNIQFGWWTSSFNYFWEDYKYKINKDDTGRDTFLRVLKSLAKMWGDFKGVPGDYNFKGYQIKNPYTKNPSIESRFYNTFIIDRSDIIRTTKSLWNNFIVKQAVKTTKALIDFNERQESGKHKFSRKITEIESSRNNYEIVELRNYIFKYMREHGGHEPNYDETFFYFKNVIASDASFVTGKPVHDLEELKTKFKCTFNWTVKNYNPDYQGKCHFDDVQLEWSSIVRNLKFYKNYLLVTAYNKNTYRYISKKTNLSISTISRIKKLSKEKIEFLKETYKKYRKIIIENNKKYYKGNKNNKYIKLIESIDSIISIIKIKKLNIIQNYFNNQNRKFKLNYAFLITNLILNYNKKSETKNIKFIKKNGFQTIFSLHEGG